MRSDHIKQFHDPIYKWQLIRMLPSLGRIATRKGATGELFKHQWKAPAWPSIQPKDDATTDMIKIGTNMDSRRHLMLMRGIDFDETMKQSLRDNGAVIMGAIKIAEALNKQFPAAKVDWREVINWGLPKGMNLTGTLDDDENTATNGANNNA
jgi:hypothetical protein